ncbi:phosphotransferase enzyme family protein [Actinoplanes sp. CA-015351]|uniref:phosphotransferase enzyme family protein n=1 Tax=Actinoplanes sp. CA-015351 TaxID=3239897 RepID=UPI003D962512
MISNEQLRACLAAEWGLADPVVEVHNGGMNSATWFIDSPTRPGQRRVAKAVAPADRPAFTAGLAVATAVEAAGIPAGAPVPTRSGDLVATDVPLALLTWVPGSPLPGSPLSGSPLSGGPLSGDDQRVIGATLARVHQALRDVSVPGEETFHWLDPRSTHLAIRPWLRDAITGAIAAYDELGALTTGLLHTDPAPEAFRLDTATGVCGLIDWSIAMRGPLLYDLASAVMYAGDGVVNAYPMVDLSELERGLPTMIRFRWAVQADYFARRIATGELTGITSQADNEKGLADAEANLR